MQAAPDVLRATDQTIQSISVEGASLAYIEQGSGTPVVFVHGAITDLRIWFDQVADIFGSIPGDRAQSPYPLACAAEGCPRVPIPAKF